MDIKELASALVAFQADLKPVGKGATNPFYKSKYADLPSVMESIQPLLAKNKLAISQFPTNINGVSALRTILIHESGQTIEDTTPLLLSKQDAQSQGSAITYARRYGVMSVLGIVAGEDDDGNAASNKGQSMSTNPVTPNKHKIATDDQKVKIKALLALEGVNTVDMPKALENEYKIKVGSVMTYEQAEYVINDLTRKD